jgi:branched-chain amino acid transport system substrate-binding protein
MPNNEASMGHRTTLRRCIYVLFGAYLLAFPALAAGPDGATVRIAVVGPADGPQAKTTEALSAGARAAAQSLSSSSARADQVHAATYEVTVKDDGCDAAKAEAAAKEIVEQNFDLVLGHPCPKAALAAAKVYGAAGVTFIATETRHPDLTGKRTGPSVFRLSGRDDAQGLDAAHYLEQARGGKPVAIVHDRTLYAKTIAEQAIAALKEKKIEPVTATIISGDKEYSKLVAKIKDAGAVFFAGFPMEAGFILKGLRAAGSKALFLATETLATQEFTSTFPDMTMDVFALRPSQDVIADQATAATMGVRLYAQAIGVAVGPAKDPAGRRALINYVLARYRDPASKAELVKSTAVLPPSFATIADIHTIVFDTSGNANIASYGLVRWDGAMWQPALRLR